MDCKPGVLVERCGVGLARFSFILNLYWETPFTIRILIRI